MNASPKIKKIINDILIEINDKREKIKSFKQQYLSIQLNNGNNIESDKITLKINSLNSLFKEFENIISLSLELISSFQKELDQIYFNTHLNNNKDNNYSNKLQMNNNLYKTYINGQINNYSTYYTNSGLDELYYRKKNYPSLKEKTLRTLYNGDNGDYINYLNRQNYTIPDNDLDNKSFDAKPKNQIKKGLRTLIKEKQLGNKSCNQLIKSNKREKNTKNDENIIKKINSSEKCKNYFSEKYGKGSYLNFLNKYKMGLLNEKELKNDYIIFANLLELKDEIKNNMNKNQNNNNDYKKFNKKNNINESDKLNDINTFMKSNIPIGIRKNILNKKINSLNKNVYDKNRVDLEIKDINNRPRINTYSKIEELIKSFEDQ